MLHGVENKEDKQGEFKAPLNTEVMTRYGKKNPCPKNILALNSAFTGVHLHTWGEPHARRMLLCRCPCAYVLMPICKNREKFL